MAHNLPEIIIGSSFDHEATITLLSGADMSDFAVGANITAEVRSSSSSSAALLEMVVSEVSSSAESLVVQLFAGVSVTSALAPGNAVYRVRFSWPDEDRGFSTAWIPIRIRH